MMVAKKKFQNVLSKEVFDYLEEILFIEDSGDYWKCSELLHEVVIDPFVENAKAQNCLDSKEREALLASAKKHEQIIQIVARATVRLDIDKISGCKSEYDPASRKARIYSIKLEEEHRKSSIDDSMVKSRLDDGTKHTYLKPHFYEDIKKILSDSASHVVWLSGPTGTGKTVMVDNLCKEMNCVKYQLNCHHGMGPESFFGERTIQIDPSTIVSGNPQNVVVFKEGIVTKAMKQGLDDNGNVIPNHPAGLLFIDEAGAMPSHIAIALNRLLESDNCVRKITLEHDGGREVKSHPNFRIVLAANTNGRGTSSSLDCTYTAQGDALDGSLLNRIAATFRFGYDRRVEDHIIRQKLGDSPMGAELSRFRDAIRNAMKENGSVLATPFSTRHIVKICDMVRVFKNVEKSVYMVVFEQLTSDERAKYNEIYNTVIGRDILSSMVSNAQIDYF